MNNISHQLTLDNDVNYLSDENFSEKNNVFVMEWFVNVTDIRKVTEIFSSVRSRSLYQIAYT